MELWKRSVGALSTVALLTTLLPAAAFAEDGTPNLTVDAIEITSTNQLTATLSNTGDVDVAEDVGVYFYIDDMDSPAWTYDSSTLSDQSFLSAGGTSSITPQALEEGKTYDIKVCVDPSDVITESDEDDNCLSVENLAVGEVELPDLVVDDIYVDEDNGALSIMLQNESDVDVEETVSIYIYINDMDDADWTYRSSTLNDQSFLDAGGTSVIQPEILTAGETYEVKACVDALDEVAESDEDNNCQTEELTVDDDSQDDDSDDQDDDDDQGDDQGDDQDDDDSDDDSDSIEVTDLNETYYLYVYWGNMDRDMIESLIEEGADADGAITFEGAIKGRVKSTLFFETGEDEITEQDRGKSFSFDSSIHGASDGILFKIYANTTDDLTEAVITLNTDLMEDEVSISLEDLLADEDQAYREMHSNGYYGAGFALISPEEYVSRFNQHVLLQTRIGNLDGNGSTLDDEHLYTVTLSVSDESVIKAAAGVFLEEHEEEGYDQVEYDESEATLYSGIYGYQDGMLTYIKLVDATSGERSITVEVTDNETGEVVFHEEFTKDDELGTFDLADDSGNQIEITNHLRFRDVDEDDAEETYEEYLEDLEDADEEDIDEIVEEAGDDEDDMSDIPHGAWFENYVWIGVELGLFNGYEDVDGRPLGMFGPADSISRAQTLKVTWALAQYLDMGAGEDSSCDPDTVEYTDASDWATFGDNDHWSRGYLECIYQWQEDTGNELSILEDIIDENFGKLTAATHRWEFIMTAFEVLEINTSDYDFSSFDDIEDSGLQTDVQAMIETAVELGIISGDDGTQHFSPFRAVNRAEAAKILVLIYSIYGE
jgi:hypothetical protein